MKNNPITRENGRATWVSKIGDIYLVTGVDKNNKRFSCRSLNWAYIKAINIWRGTRWLIRDGRRYKIQSVFN